MPDANAYFLPASWAIDIPVCAGVSITNSNQAFDGFNIAYHVEDTPKHVLANRETLCKATKLENRWLWMNQIHSDVVLDNDSYVNSKNADAIISRSRDFTAVVMTADCIPILLTNSDGTEVAAIHAGWKGLYQGIISNTIAQMQSNINDIYAWIGPCIRQSSYEVDSAFRERFIALNKNYVCAFLANRKDHYLADLVKIAMMQLVDIGIIDRQITDSKYDTFTDKHFYSYRRDSKKSGRSASFIAPI